MCVTHILPSPAAAFGLLCGVMHTMLKVLHSLCTVSKLNRHSSSPFDSSTRLFLALHLGLQKNLQGWSWWPCFWWGCIFAWLLLRHALSGTEVLLFARSACWLSEHALWSWSCHHWRIFSMWMNDVLEVSGVWGKAGAEWWRWENPVPRAGVLLGRWEGLKIKEVHCIITF